MTLRISDMCIEAVLHAEPATLERLPDRIRQTAAAGYVGMDRSALESMLADGWCKAVELVIGQGVPRSECQRSLNLYRRHFGLAESALGTEGHFEAFRMMTMLRSLSHDGIVPRFDGKCQRSRNNDPLSVT